MRFRYYCTSRPPGFYNTPQGHVELKSTLLQDHTTPQGDEVRGGAHGWIEYEYPLSFKQIYSYDLLPADKLERCKFLLWRSNGRTLTDLQTEIEFWDEVFTDNPHAIEALCEENWEAELAHFILNTLKPVDEDPVSYFRGQQGTTHVEKIPSEYVNAVFANNADADRIKRDIKNGWVIEQDKYNYFAVRNSILEGTGYE